eukprot:7485494-Alexandrium_andersonii.AAC.3
MCIRDSCTTRGFTTTLALTPASRPPPQAARRDPVCGPESWRARGFGCRPRSSQALAWIRAFGRAIASQASV